MSITDTMRQDPAHREWMEYLESLDTDGVELFVPDEQRLPAVLDELGVPEADIPHIMASQPSPEGNPEEWWLLERCVASIVSSMGAPNPPPGFPPPMDIAGLDPYFYVHVFVAALPHVGKYHRAHGIPQDVARATLADLGRNVRVHRKRYGKGGMGVAFWISLHFRGTIYQLGRLQFERTRMRETVAMALRERGEDVSEDDLVLSVHIPDFMGPLSPEACDESIGKAKTFFARHFPEERYGFAVCHSWLLDPQLAEYLPEASNIVRFQNRFQLAEGGRDADTSILQFVFGPAPENLDELPQRSSLERAVVTHLRRGGHWFVRSGWFALS